MISIKLFKVVAKVRIRLFLAALQRFEVGQNPLHLFNVSRVCPLAKKASKTVDRSILRGFSSKESALDKGH